MKAMLVINLYDNVELPKRMFIDKLRLSSFDGKMLPIDLENVELIALPETIEYKEYDGTVTMEAHIRDIGYCEGWNDCIDEIVDKVNDIVYNKDVNATRF